VLKILRGVFGPKYCIFKRKFSDRKKLFGQFSDGQKFRRKKGELPFSAVSGHIATKRRERLHCGAHAAMSASLIPALRQRSFSASICFCSDTHSPAHYSNKTLLKQSKNTTIYNNFRLIWRPKVFLKLELIFVKNNTLKKIIR